MGFPMIQVFMIAARQVSKPIADAVLKYGKDHPVFRNKLLIPIGRGIVRFTSRLRMKRLGLGEPISHVPVSEAAALEQASDFVQQLVLFSYSVGVFASYYFYTKLTTPESLKLEDYLDFKEQHERSIKELRLQIESLEQRLAAQQKRNFFSSLVPFSSEEEPPKKKTNSAEDVPSTSSQASTTTPKSKQRFERISSLPVDAAASLILDEEEYLIVRRGSSVGIELSANFSGRLQFRIPDRKPENKSRIQEILEKSACHIIG